MQLGDIDVSDRYHPNNTIQRYTSLMVKICLLQISKTMKMFTKTWKSAMKALPINRGMFAKTTNPANCFDPTL